jgi:uncharacterized protein
MPSIPQSVSDTLRPAGTARFGGFVGGRIDACIRNGIARQSIDNLVQPFIDRPCISEWRSEFWGKWMASLITAIRYTGGDESLRALADRSVEALLATQDDQGYIGSFRPEHRLQRWDVWGRKYSLIGLIEYFDLTGCEKALAGAVRMVEHLIAETGEMSAAELFRLDRWNGMATSSILEPLVLLYQRTGRADFLAYAERLVSLWEQPEGPDLLRKIERSLDVFDMFPPPNPTGHEYRDGGYSKAYEMMSCYEGVLELYRATGNPRYRHAVVKLWQNILETEITLIGTGSDWERWIGGRRKQTQPWREGMEICVTVYWLKLTLQLLRLTGESRYADAFETGYYNALLGSLRGDGGWWAHYATLDGTRIPAHICFKMDQQCCVANGPRGLLMLPQHAVMQRSDGIAVCFYGPMTSTSALGDGSPVRLEQSTSYPEEGLVRLRVYPQGQRAFTLALRIPAWTTSTRLRINGQTLESSPDGNWLQVQRTWRPGDEVELQLDLAARVVAAPDDARHRAIARGPIVLARDVRFDPAIDMPLRLEPATKLDLQRIGAPPEAWLAFRHKSAQGTVTLVDYASAGNTWAPTSRFRVWLDQPAR